MFVLFHRFLLSDCLEFLGRRWHFLGLFVASLHSSRIPLNGKPVYWDWYVCSNRMIIQYFICAITQICFPDFRLHDVLSFRRSDHDPGPDQSVLFTACGHYGQRNCVNVGRSRLRIRRPAADDELVDFVAPLRFASALDAPFAAKAGLRECDPVIWMLAQSSDQTRGARAGAEDSVWPIQRVAGTQLLGPPIRSVTNGPRAATSAGRLSLLGFLRFGPIGRPIVFQAGQPEIIASQKDEASIELEHIKQSIFAPLDPPPKRLAGFLHFI